MESGQSPLTARSVQHDLIQACALEDAVLGGRFDGLSQQPPIAGLANALAPAHKARRITGQIVLEAAPGGGDELWAPFVGEGLPIDQIPEPNQFVAVVDEVDPFGAEQVVITTLVDWLRIHRYLDAVCNELILIDWTEILQSVQSSFSPNRLHSCRLAMMFRADSVRRH